MFAMRLPVEFGWLGDGARGNDFIGGAEEDRTPDLRSAIAALSQLSYGPNMLVSDGGMVCHPAPS
jgi:hypothetical protein